MSKRRSIRHFSSKEVDRKILHNAIETAGAAPSGANRQPWHFALITNQILKNNIRQAAEEVEKTFYEKKASEDWLKELQPLATNAVKTYLSEAPALIAVFSRSLSETSQGELKRSYYPIESTGIATGFLLAALHNAGLATLTHTPQPMFFLNNILNLNKSYRPFMIVVVGYPKEPIQMPNLNRKQLFEIMSEY